jgi:hypothetical protein
VVNTCCGAGLWFLPVGPILPRVELSKMEKVSMKRKSDKDSGEYKTREDKLTDEIIDLVDVAHEYLETIETDLNFSGIEDDDLNDTLDEELLGDEGGVSSENRTREKDKRPVFEEELVELFESGESAAAELLEEKSPTEKPAVDSAEAGDRLTGGDMEHPDQRFQASIEKDGTDGIPETTKEFSKNLFLDIELVKETPDEKAGANQAAYANGESGVTSDKKDWLDSGFYYPESVKTIDRKIEEYENKIQKLVHNRKKIQKTYEELRSILYLEGEELKKAVAIILAKYWSLKLSFMNKAKRAGFNENILIKHDDRVIMAKIKGTHSVYPFHKFITQVWQDLYFSGLGTRAEGALIVNHDIGSDPESRRLPYADEDAEQLGDLIFVDTRVLHRLTTAIIDGDLPVDRAKEILFKKGRVEFKGSSRDQTTSEKHA